MYFKKNKLRTLIDGCFKPAALDFLSHYAATKEILSTDFGIEGEEAEKIINKALKEAKMEHEEYQEELEAKIKELVDQGYDRKEAVMRLSLEKMVNRPSQ